MTLRAKQNFRFTVFVVVVIGMLGAMLYAISAEDHYTRADAAEDAVSFCGFHGGLATDNADGFYYNEAPQEAEITCADGAFEVTSG